MRTRMVVGVAAYVFAGLFAVGATRPARRDGEARFDRDITYITRHADDGDIELKLNLARPAEDGKKHACIVAIHGGAWRAGDRTHLDALVQGLAKEGYVAATVSYRFCPQHRFPAQVEDCAAAVRFLRKHAEEYGIDPDRIGAIGFSAGAHLSMMLGVLDAKDGMGIVGEDPADTGKVRAVVSFFGPTLLGAADIPVQSRGLVADFVGPEPEGAAERWKAASPVTYVTTGDAPTLLFQGSKDRLVPVTQPAHMIEAMTKAGVEGRAEIIAGADHGWAGTELERTLKVSKEFFDEQLRRSKPLTKSAPDSGK